ncbi:MAG TPA: NAD(P)/FAD-dependent oxidoreductase [Nitrososphaeraceae archaeon]|nr:NAD(P)/FAD-dependent oxidoreductase [Nitrososphaeraceae archaeon]
MDKQQQEEKERTFDLVVIGTGTAASTTAADCSSAGWSVAVIDSLPFGGTCALRGCDPKKVLVEAARVIDSNQRHEGKGIIGSEAIHIKWNDLIRFKRTFTDPFPKNREDGYINAGIAPFHGHARFIGPTTVKVEKIHSNSNNNNNNKAILNSRHILIATGSKPMSLNVPGSENIITSDQFLDFGYDRLPDRIVFVGGGYISFEFAHIAARAGAKVTILHRGKRPLEHFDPDLVNRLVERSRDIGIDVRLRSEVKSIDKLSSILSSSSPSTTKSSSHSHKLIVHYSSSLDNSKHGGNNDKISKIQADMVVHGAGREPNIDTLDLNAAGIEYTHRGITVNQYLQSISNPSVYAAGDAAANMGLPLTPVASYDGAVVANNLIKGNTLKSNYTGLPSVVFTIPPLVSVGMQEKEAKEKGLRVKINYQDTSGWASNRRVGETCAAFKVLVDEDTNKILGAHILGPHADEIINIFSIAIRLGLTTKDLNDPILYTYPTTSSDILYMLQ